MPIFGFHDLVDLSDPSETPPQRRSFSSDYDISCFKQFLEYLLAQDFWFLSAYEYDTYFIKGALIPRDKRKLKPILLTFDDGYAGIYDHLLPLLRKKYAETGKKVKVVLFLHSGGIGERWLDLRYLTCAQIREGYAEGYFDLQSHSVSHTDLTKLNTYDLNRELRISQEHLRDCLAGLSGANQTANYLAYPYGANNILVQKAAAKYYLAAFTYNDQLTREPRTNSYALGRWQVSRDQPLEKLIEKASP
ncbi:MAG: polysaccharide deacetylase family protein [Candidatus Caenarcaniphilales bacterium]|nr:polysaccharide deacetylase family protein [Candidatus Caenarcaniphilales bacterium]